MGFATGEVVRSPPNRRIPSDHHPTLGPKSSLPTTRRGELWDQGEEATVRVRVQGRASPYRACAYTSTRSCSTRTMSQKSGRQGPGRPVSEGCGGASPGGVLSVKGAFSPRVSLGPSLSEPLLPPS